MQPQSEKKFFKIQQMGRKLATFLMLKKAFEKKVCKKFLKNLVVKKKGLTFAPLSALKN